MSSNGKWTTGDIPDQRGRVAVVTGANTGLGYHTAAALAQAGAQVILAVHGMAWVTGQVIECDGGLSLRSPIDSYGEGMRARSSKRSTARPNS